VDLKFAGIPVAYMWPSKGRIEPLAYGADEGQISKSAVPFENFLRLVLGKTGAARVHVIAHSLGNRALVAALANVQNPPRDHAVGSPAFDEVVMGAPDVDTEAFEAALGSLAKSATRITLYASSHDYALEMSELIHQKRRLGEGGDKLLVAEPLESIDATAVDVSLIGHSYIFDNRLVMSDLAELISKHAAAGDRFQLESRARSEGTYYEFRQ
jgi:esterase/lipase superfamily enzyme